MSPSSEPFDFAGQPVLITGASSGIGFACAQALVQAGARHLLLTGRDSDKLASARAALQQPGVCIDVQVCDQGSRADVEQLVAYLDAHGWPGVFIANVGVNPVHTYGPKKLHGLDLDFMEQTIATNITHNVFLLSRVVKAMRARRTGRVLLVGSQSWHYGIAGQALYNLCKSSLLGLKNSVVSEYGSNGIYCHLLSPGVVLNERTRKLREQHPALAAQQGVTESEVASAVLALLRINDPARNGQDVLI